MIPGWYEDIVTVNAWLSPSDLISTLYSDPIPKGTPVDTEIRIFSDITWSAFLKIS